MEEEKKINAEELKEETKETFNKVKSEIKDTDFKEETKNATNFVKEMLMNPIAAVKEVAEGHGPKLATIIMIIIGLIVVGLAYALISSFRYSSIYDSLGDKVWNLVTSVTETIFLILVPAIIIFIMNRKEKKSLLTVISTMAVAQVPNIFITITNIVYMLISSLSFIITPINAGLGVAQTVLAYFGMKTLMKEDDETFIIKFVIIEVLVTFAMFVLRRIGIC